MRTFVLLATAATFLTGCRESNPVIEVTKTRRVTYFDQVPPGNIVDFPPLGWRTIPPTLYRDLNFRAGENEAVEIYLTNATGGVLENANRWLGQFGLSPVPDESAFQAVEILGRNSILVEADGTYSAGMGGKDKEDAALVGALRPTNGGLLTIKMVGPKEEVQKMRSEFIQYCETLRITNVTEIESEPTKEDQNSTES